MTRPGRAYLSDCILVYLFPAENVKKKEKKTVENALFGLHDNAVNNTKVRL